VSTGDFTYFGALPSYVVYDNNLYHMVIRVCLMRFSMPNFPCEFELPDEWWGEAGMTGFRPQGLAYRSTAAAMLVPLTTIEPVYRRETCPKDWRGFDRDRLIRILKGLVVGAEIEPVPLVKLPETDYPSSPYGFRVLNGFHRFYASIAAGFEYLPADIS
jgi:hypothetical protein